jgi:site-specific DNA recombinase
MTVPNPDLTAIYCRKSAKGDRQQVTVNRQKRLALDDCEKLGLIVVPHNIFIDNGASAWQRNRKRLGWDELIAACKRGAIKHIVCYHPDRLMRQPRDLEELLSISDQYGITLYGRLNERDLQDPDDRYALRIEIAHACRSSDDSSRRLKDKFQEMAEAGIYHGPRPYGYAFAKNAKGGLKIAPAEAGIVREIYARFTQGESPSAISVDLNGRGIRTTRGKLWDETTVRRLLQAKHVAAINVHNGVEIGIGVWPAIIARPQWEFAQEILAFRSAAAQSARSTRTPRVYILRGLAVCGKCGTTMSGCSNSVYRCTHTIRREDAKKCSRSMLAEPLEKFVEDAAVRLLENLTVSPKPKRTAAVEDSTFAVLRLAGQRDYFPAGGPA